MADRNAEHLATQRAERIAAYDAGIAAYHAQNLDEPPTPELKRAAIANCGLCDKDGYRGQRVCDHQDHTEAARRGIEACRAALSKGDPA